MGKLKPIITFTLMTFVLSLAFLISDSMATQALYLASPAIAALLLILCSTQKRKALRALGVGHLGKGYWYVIAMVLPITAIFISYFIASSLGYFSLNFNMPWYRVIYQIGITTFMGPFLGALLEELGWRGFLQPKLTALLGFRLGLFFTGVIWAGWHYVFILSGHYYEAGSLLINIPLFTTTVVLISFSIGWIRSESHSLWPCVVFHSASNAVWEVCSEHFKIKNPDYIYISGEAGMLNIIFWGGILFIIWRRLGGKRHIKT